MATSVAWLIAHDRRRRVALVDLDLQFGTVALSLDLEPSHGLREALENPNRIDGLFMDRVLIQHSERLFVLSAEESPDETLLLDYGAVELLMTELRNKFHYVVVDIPRSPQPARSRSCRARPTWSWSPICRSPGCATRCASPACCRPPTRRATSR